MDLFSTLILAFMSLKNFEDLGHRSNLVAIYDPNRHRLTISDPCCMGLDVTRLLLTFSYTYKVLTTSRPKHTASITIWSLFNPLARSHLAVPLLIRCHPFSPTNHLLIENNRSLIQIYITPFLESIPWFIPSVSPVTHLLIHLSVHLCHHIPLISPSITPSLCHSRLKTYLFNKSLSFPP